MSVLAIRLFLSLWCIESRKFIDAYFHHRDCYQPQTTEGIF